MARFAIASPHGGCLSWALRLKAEGHDVLLHIGDEDDSGSSTSSKRIGRELVPRIENYAQLVAWAKEGVRSRIPTMILFASSHLGKRADEARKMGLYVVGGGGICDRMEFDRPFGKRVAGEAGMNIPPFETFPTLDATIAFAKAGKIWCESVYFKTDSYIKDDCTKKCKDAESLVNYLEGLKDQDVPNATKNELEECMPGVAVSTERWWNGRAFVGPFFNLIERKKFMSDEVGPSTGCSMNAVWAAGDSCQTAEALNWDRLTEVFLKHEIPPGLYDANAILSDGEAYFLEWCARLGYDSEPTAQLLYHDMGQFLWHIATGQGSPGEFRSELAISIHLSVPPYPSAGIMEINHKSSPVGDHISGETGTLCGPGFVAYDVYAENGVLMIGSPDGDVGLSAAVGDSLEDLADEVYDFAKEKIEVSGLQYRNDAGEALKEDAEKASEEGFTDMHEGLFQ